MSLKVPKISGVPKSSSLFLLNPIGLPDGSFGFKLPSDIAWKDFGLNSGFGCRALLVVRSRKYRWASQRDFPRTLVGANPERLSSESL